MKTTLPVRIIISAMATMSSTRVKPTRLAAALRFMWLPRSRSVRSARRAMPDHMAIRVTNSRIGMFVLGTDAPGSAAGEAW